MGLWCGKATQLVPDASAHLRSHACISSWLDLQAHAHLRQRQLQQTCTLRAATCCLCSLC